MFIFSKGLSFSLKPLLSLAGLMSPAGFGGVCSSSMEAKPPFSSQHRGITSLLSPGNSWKWNYLSPGAIPYRWESSLILCQGIWTLSQIQLFFFTYKRRSIDCLFLLFFRKQQLNSALWVEKEACENMAYGCLPENCASCLLKEIVMCSWHSL